MMFKVNAALVPIKAHFFLFFAALAPILPFLPIYAKQLGIDTVGVGVVFAGEATGDQKVRTFLIILFLSPTDNWKFSKASCWMDSRQVCSFLNIEMKC